MSTTADKAVALQYSGVREGRPKAMVLVITVSAVDRGACVRDLSQAPPPAPPRCCCLPSGSANKNTRRPSTLSGSMASPGRWHRLGPALPPHLSVD